MMLNALEPTPRAVYSVSGSSACKLFEDHEYQQHLPKFHVLAHALGDAQKPPKHGRGREFTLREPPRREKKRATASSFRLQQTFNTEAVWEKVAPVRAVDIAFFCDLDTMGSKDAGNKWNIPGKFRDRYPLAALHVPWERGPCCLLPCCDMTYHAAPRRTPCVR